MSKIKNFIYFIYNINKIYMNYIYLIAKVNTYVTDLIALARTEN